MQDRLHDLRELAVQKNPTAAERMHQGPSAATRDDRRVQFDIEAQMGIVAGADDKKGGKFMAEYFAKTETLKKGIAEIRQAVETMKQIKKDAMRSTSAEKEKEYSRQSGKVVDATNKTVVFVKKQLEDIKEQNNQFAAKHPNSSEARIRENMHTALTRKFREILGEYQTAQTDLKQDMTDKVARQVKIVYPEASDEELQHMVNDGDASAAIKARIMGGHESLKNALSDVQDKYRDIKKLEQSVAELHQMFVDLATLVDAQGELLDQIEFNVNSAKDYTEKAEKEVTTAKKYQATAKKRMCWLSVCLVILAILIMLPLIVMFTK